MTAAAGARTSKARRYAVGYGFVLPWLCGLTFFIAYPFLAAGYFSFCDFAPLRGAMFIGTANYSELAGDAAFVHPGASRYHFGVLSSAMHMAWVRQVCGRLESRYRYSARLVYNNYPWPETPGDKRRAAVETAAQAVLDVREESLRGGSTLAGLYDPALMPASLARAHAALDRAVDRCYRRQPFTGERQRVEFLFALYERLASPPAAPNRTPRR